MDTWPLLVRYNALSVAPQPPGSDAVSAELARLMLLRCDHCGGWVTEETKEMINPVHREIIASMATMVIRNGIMSTRDHFS